MSEVIGRQEFEGAITAVGILTKELEELYKELKKISDAAVASGKAIKEGTNTDEVSKHISQLTEEEKELVKVQNQISTALAKQNDEYISNKKALDDLNKLVKDKIVLGDKDAKQVTAMNSSINQLQAALNKNRAMYSSLRTEQERNSKVGKDLLTVIQKQSKEFDELRKSMGQNKEVVVSLGESFGALDQLTGGLMGRFKDMGKQLMALATNPFFIAIAGAVALFKALQYTAEAYYTTTLQGEEAAKKSTAQWDAFFAVFKRGFVQTGKDVSSTGEKISEFFTDLAFMIRGPFAGMLIKEKNRVAKEMKELSDMLSKLFKDHLKDMVDDANTELRVNELLEDSKKKLLLTDEQRLKALRDARDLLKEQLKGDIQLANDDIKAQEKLVSIAGGKIAQITEQDKATGKLITRNKTVAEMSEQEIYDLKLIGEEVKKLAELQVARINLESKAAVQRRALLKQEIQLVQEIEHTRVENVRRGQDAIAALQKQKIVNTIEQNKTLLKMSAKTAEDQLAIEDKLYTQELELLRKNKASELLTIKRSAEDRLKEQAQIFANNEMEKNAEMTAEEFIKIQDKKLAELIRKDVDYQNEVKTTNLKFYNEQIQQAQRYADSTVKIQQHRIVQELTYQRRALDAEIQLIKQAAIDGKITKEEADKQILNAQKKSADEYIQIQIDAVRKNLAIKGLSVEEEIKLEEQLYKLKVDLQNAFFGQLEDDTKKLEELLTKVLDIYTMFANSIGHLVHSLTENKLEDIDREEKALDEQLDRELERLDEETEARIAAAGENAEAVAAIKRGADKEQQLIEDQAEARRDAIEKKRIAQQRKAAIFDKAVMAVQAGIATALAVVKALPNIPLAVAVGAAGAIEVAAILAKQIPAFEDGGIHTKGGLLIAGEAGEEIAKVPGKGFFMTPGVPTLMSAPAGTEFFDHNESMRMLATSGLGVNTDRQPTEKEYRELRNLGRKLDSLEYTVRTKPVVENNYTSKGLEVVLKKGLNKIKTFQEKYR
jgi:hypothetical protein